MDYQFSFEKLEVWQLSRKLVVRVYKQTQLFPVEERFGLVSHLRRSVLAVGANIDEGITRTSIKDQAHFTTIAFSSLMEFLNHLIISADLGYIKEDELKQCREEVQALSVKLSNLRTSQLKRAGN